MRYQTELIKRKDGLDLKLREHKPKRLEMQIDRLKDTVDALIIVTGAICSVVIIVSIIMFGE